MYIPSFFNNLHLVYCLPLYSLVVVVPVVVCCLLVTSPSPLHPRPLFSHFVIHHLLFSFLFSRNLPPTPDSQIVTKVTGPGIYFEQHLDLLCTSDYMYVQCPGLQLFVV